MKNHNLVFLCGARDYHAMDWYRSAIELYDYNKVSILTDLIQAEGYKKLITKDDIVHKLIIIDKFLFQKQSKYSNLWRNIIKFILIPFQVIKIKLFNKKNPNTVFYAHSMYYIWLANFANVRYIGTPQGSDILRKPYKSKIYKFLSKYGLRNAEFITVDSVNMKNKCYEISNVEPIIIQNGIDTTEILKKTAENKHIRNKITSIRGFTPLYRLNELINIRNRLEKKISITFVYPFMDNNYKNNCQLKNSDMDLGRLNRIDLYDILLKSKLVISIPSSDSSPRSVYEAIFLGAAVAITYNEYYEVLPNCMKSRIIIVDLKDDNWFKNALIESKEIIKTKYIPSKKALIMFNQKESLKQIFKKIN